MVLTLHAVKALDYDVIGMVKKTPKMFFRYNNEDMPLTSIYKKNKKKRGRSKYLLSVMIEIVKDGGVIPAKVVYVQNRNKKKDCLCLISTDISLNEEEILHSLFYTPYIGSVLHCNENSAKNFYPIYWKG